MFLGFFGRKSSINAQQVSLKKSAGDCQDDAFLVIMGWITLCFWTFDIVPWALQLGATFPPQNPLVAPHRTRWRSWPQVMSNIVGYFNGPELVMQQHRITKRHLVFFRTRKASYPHRHRCFLFFLQVKLMWSDPVGEEVENQRGCHFFFFCSVCLL